MLFRSSRPAARVRVRGPLRGATTAGARGRLLETAELPRATPSRGARAVPRPPPAAAHLPAQHTPVPHAPAARLLHLCARADQRLQLQPRTALQRRVRLLCIFDIDS